MDVWSRYSIVLTDSRWKWVVGPFHSAESQSRALFGRFHVGGGVVSYDIMQTVHSAQRETACIRVQASSPTT